MSKTDARLHDRCQLTAAEMQKRWDMAFKPKPKKEAKPCRSKTKQNSS